MTGEELVLRAEGAAANAYAPYSRYLVGASVLARDGRVFDGVKRRERRLPARRLLGEDGDRRRRHRGAPAWRPRGDRHHRLAVRRLPPVALRWRFDRVWFRRDDGSIAEYAPAELLPDTWDLPPA